MAIAPVLQSFNVFYFVVGKNSFTYSGLIIVGQIIRQ